MTASTAYERTPGASGLRFDPAADVAREAVGLARPPGALVVQADLRRVGHHLIDDPPLLLECIGPAEAARVTVHRVFEQALVRLGPLAEDPLVLHLEIDGLRLHLV